MAHPAALGFAHRLDDVEAAPAREVEARGCERLRMLDHDEPCRGLDEVLVRAVAVDVEHRARSRAAPASGRRRGSSA